MKKYICVGNYYETPFVEIYEAKNYEEACAQAEDNCGAHIIMECSTFNKLLKKAMKQIRV